jgi:hypothetical protein
MTTPPALQTSTKAASLRHGVHHLVGMQANHIAAMDSEVQSSNYRVLHETSFIDQTRRSGEVVMSVRTFQSQVDTRTSRHSAARRGKHVYQYPGAHSTDIAPVIHLG